MARADGANIMVLPGLTVGTGADDITTISVDDGGTNSGGAGGGGLVDCPIVPHIHHQQHHHHQHHHHHQRRRGSGRSLRSEDGDTSPNTPVTSGSLDDTHLCPDTPKIRVNDATPTGHLCVSARSQCVSQHVARVIWRASFVARSFIYLCLNVLIRFNCCLKRALTFDEIVSAQFYFYLACLVELRHTVVAEREAFL